MAGSDVLASALALLLAACVTVHGLWWRRRLQADEKLRREMLQSRFDQIAQLVNDPILLLSPDGRILDCNDKLIAAYGYSRQELLRLTLSDLSVAASPPSAPGGNGGWIHQAVHRRQNGETFSVEVSTRIINFAGVGYHVAIIRDISASIRAAEALAESERRLQEALRLGQMGGWEVDVTSRRVTWTEEMYVLLERERSLGPPTLEEVIDWYRPRDRADMRDAVARAVSRGEASQLDVMLTLPSGRTAWHSSTVVPVRDVGGRIVRLRGTTQDITARKRAEEQSALATTVFRHCSEGIMVCDGRNDIVSVNPAFEEITGYAAADVLGENPRLLGSRRQDDDFYKTMWQAIAETGHWEGEIWDRRKSGELYAEWLSINTVKDDHGEVLWRIGIFSDITERLETAKRIHHLAYHDPLTQLPNRILLRERVEHGLANAERHGKKIALLYLDLDRFKMINDSLGHDAGDQLLKSVAGRLKESVRSVDTVARLGGDEFAVALQDVDQGQDAAAAANKILASLRESHRLDGHSVASTPSIGISVFPDDGEDYETLLHHADLAMYHAKQAGRGTYRFFCSDMNVKARERVNLETALRRALERGEFVLHYQPQVDLDTGCMIGMEALLRWAHPERGLLGPDAFLGIAEESGLIVPIGDWVLATACEDMARWRGAHCPPVPVSVNLSPTQLRQGRLATEIAADMKRWGIDPAQLDLEITEQSMMQPTEATVGVLHELTDMGLALSVDDFGTGYSSLSYLKHFPISNLKIDRSFVHDVRTNDDDAAITTAIIALARSLRLGVIAEGVETEGTAEFLRERGCHRVQGFHFGRPEPADRMAQRLAAAGA